MKVSRALVILCLFSVITIAPAAEEETEKACAVSKHVYDLFQAMKKAADAGDTPEVPADFPPESEDFEGCLASVKSLTNHPYLVGMGAAMCENRHPCQQTLHFIQ